MKDFVKYYSEYDEDTRLQRHRTEFISTTYILDKFIHSGQRILDVGAGTGPYSLYYAEKGCSVVAIDAVPKYIYTLRSKLQLKPDLDIQTHVADIREPFPASIGKFDAILFMGPIYHVPEPELEPCWDKCLKVLNRNGIFAASYVNAFQGYEKDTHSDYFIHHSHSDIERILGQLNLTRLCHVPTDGEVFGELNELAQRKSEPVDKLHAWLDKNPSVLTDPSWMSTSIHCLYVGKKTM